MFNFILITKNHLNIETLKDFLNSLFKNYQVKELDNHFLILHSDSDKVLLQEAFNSYICDTYESSKVYFGYTNSELERDFEISVIVKYFNDELINTIYNLNELLLETNLVNDDIRKVVFKKYYSNYTMYNTLKVFFINNMNTLKSSKELFMHRNTLINQIEKFKEVTSFDPKEFKDAYVLYSLIK